MKTYTKILLIIAILFLCVFALNWAIASAYSGTGFYIYAVINGLIIGVILILGIKAYRTKE